jgi:uncharacterized NAD(P)/FAD-binding protein YdhS
LVNRLDALGPDPTLVQLAQALAATKLAPADLAGYVQFNQQNYSRIPVAVRPQYELLVMTWLPGQASIPHDHAGSICVMQVVQGTAVEGCYRESADGYVDLEYETAVPGGEITGGQDAGVHAVHNPSQSGEVLVSVHLYAPPLRDFRRFVPRPKTASTLMPIRRDLSPAVVIVGGGFSGSMTAAQLLHGAMKSQAGVRVALVERRGAIGEGLAYGTREPFHLLNVPAGRMSAWTDRPDDFVQWATKRHGPVRPADFLPRQWYSEYVRETLLAAAQGAKGTCELSVALDEVRRIGRHPNGGWMVHVARGASLRADAVVLAIGHRQPADPIGRNWLGSRHRLIADPWRPFAMNVVGPDDEVAILGSGLTAIDAVLSLVKQNRRGPITLISRHGLLPQTHAPQPLPPANLTAWVSQLLAAPGGIRARLLCAKLRRRIQQETVHGGDWRSVVDGVRPHTAALWHALSIPERRRFLAYLRPYWEVHRHRMASAVAGRFQELLDAGQIRVVAGRVESAHAEGDEVRLVVADRLTQRSISCRAHWVVNCTGPTASNTAEGNPAIGSLLVDGWIRPDALALGIETSEQGAAIAADGQVLPDLFVIGTLRKPALWESTAVPELRSQAAVVAERVLDLLRQSRQHEMLSHAA